MEINKILSADILDIVFDGKNKQYGAYDLRKSYNKRLVKALVITGSIALFVILGTVFATIFKKNGNERFTVKDMEMVNAKADAPPPPPPPPPPPTPPPPPAVNSVQFNTFKPVPDKEAPDEKPEEVKDDQKIADVTVKSDVKDEITAKPIEEKTAAIETPKADDENKVFTKVEVDAEFQGDWASYLQKNLNGQIASDNGAPVGKHTVTMKFIVSKDGSLSDITCENDPGFGICDEAKRVLKKTKAWKPAIQNGRNVNAYRRQPITFLVDGE
jgi:periplasmic protein TonB